ncbi:hydroxyethylthiazole kinase [Rathayibacter toxicus]|uniref:Hydroxyethylthiazole kinase n=1 Tax=Rathayibacter toxicus TaxID=145458 RepID=A0A2S5Y5Y8_9MICO|nr:hydroxyethylthiazole kinase [Rathayibacter toxicus]AJM77863.1 hydroxyethylthiazole kinase [Rathayibacter toxicus]ALS57945.1 hydroxyethylthiazole kinase [Rathayibacter toxicus]PPG20371.1 hydroxyethylthiazole kinase [Rathayibacter toxicus]PPG45472.1 hydroxyethylthiazole kinase [Rathayibacter toxicus]PPH22572.1 hydroxyethylthiazole kinase [Rathayibacter toxicus]
MSSRTPSPPDRNTETAPLGYDGTTVGLDLDALRRHTPLIQCITNTVVAGFTANSLLALGASPAMCDLPDEAGVFAGIASAVLVNLGTCGSEQRQGAREAILAATKAGTGWVLDPVAVGPLPVRTAFAAEIIELGPSVIRANASEILALAGRGHGGRGVDATDHVDDAREAARALALATGAVVTVSGPVDVITDGTTDVRVMGGHPLLTRVTGGGCALGAVMAAFLGAADNTADKALRAAVAGSVVWGLAAQHAAQTATGPGSFAVALLDALSTLEASAVLREARIA